MTTAGVALFETEELDLGLDAVDEPHDGRFMSAPGLCFCALRSSWVFVGVVQQSLRLCEALRRKATKRESGGYEPVC